VDSTFQEEMMLTQKELRELLDFDAKGQKVLSLYLNTDLTRRTKEERRLALKKMLEPLGTESRGDIVRVTKFFDQKYDWQSRGIAVFACAPLKFWREVRLAVPVLDYATIGEKPNVRLLTDLMNEYERYAIALVDRDHARFFAFQLGEIEGFAYELPATPGRHRQGGWSAARYQRHIEALVLQNLKQAAQLTSDFFKSQNCSRLLLAGTGDVLAQFRGLLPKPLHERIAGEFPMGMQAPANLVLEKAREIQEHVKRAHQLALVEEMNTAARKKHPTATLGLSDTLNALMERSVYTLIAASDYRAKGFVCDGCGYLSAQKLPDCPLCDDPLRQVDNSVDLAVHKAIELGSRVELVRGRAATKLRELGGIGAMLRY
jgi:peptide subunit release factor 1 (eRF1)